MAASASSALYTRRRIINAVAVVLACATALFGLFFLGWILWTLIANDFGEATETYRSALLLLGFVLFIVTFIVLAIARFMLMQLARKEGN